MLKALIFDVDGTLADTESAHRAAFNTAFHELGLGWHWDESLYSALLQVAGGKERILHYWNIFNPDEMAASKVGEVVDQIHRIKTEHYKNLVHSGALTLRPGIQRLIQEAHAAGLPMAIATTTTAANIEALLGRTLGAGWRQYFVAVCDGGSVRNKKPAPDVYLAALEALGLAPGDCLAFEDSENGLRAALLAGIPTVVTTTAFTLRQRFEHALRVLPHLGDPAHMLDRSISRLTQDWINLAALQHWHQGRPAS